MVHPWDNFTEWLPLKILICPPAVPHILVGGFKVEGYNFILLAASLVIAH